MRKKGRGNLTLTRYIEDKRSRRVTERSLLNDLVRTYERTEKKKGRKGRGGL